ncbi:hypothetical protein WDZ92_17635 [Nostoc sp. NIES-2111]
MRFYRGLLYGIIPALVLWAVIAVVAHRAFVTLVPPAAPLLAAQDDGHSVH